MELADMLAGMDIPAGRRDTDNPDNVRWLLRNLPINNADNPLVLAAMVTLSAKRAETEGPIEWKCGNQ
jgi:hypothetical protein